MSKVNIGRLLRRVWGAAIIVHTVLPFIIVLALVLTLRQAIVEFKALYGPRVDAISQKVDEVAAELGELEEVLQPIKDALKALGAVAAALGSVLKVVRDVLNAVVKVFSRIPGVKEIGRLGNLSIPDFDLSFGRLEELASSVKGIGQDAKVVLTGTLEIVATWWKRTRIVVVVALVWLGTSGIALVARYIRSVGQKLQLGWAMLMGRPNPARRAR